MRLSRTDVIILMIIETSTELKTYLTIGKPAIAFDYGNRKIGLAITTPNHLLSLPHQIIEERDFVRQCTKCLDFIAEMQPCLVVIGLPLNMDGTKSEQTIVVEKFAKSLAGKCDVPIYLQDERLTSKTADNLLKMTGMKRKNRNQKDDLIAASLILETAMQLARG